MANEEISPYLREKYGSYAEDITALGSDDPAAVEAAVGRLAEAGDAPLEALGRALDARQLAVRSNVVRVLAGMGSAGAVDLLRRISSEDRNTEVRQLARDALSGTGGPAFGGVPRSAQDTRAASGPVGIDALIGRVQQRALKELGDITHSSSSFAAMFYKLDAMRGETAGAGKEAGDDR